jgi:UDPglucose 6-dehydrogenase
MELGKNVAVMGLGYVGLTMAACLAERGISTIGIDVDKEKISQLKKGRSPIHEPRIEEMIERNIRSGRLRVTDNCQEALENSQMTFITVGTPRSSNGKMEFEQMRLASEAIGKALKDTQPYHLIVVRSTVIPGTTGRIIRPIVESNSKKSCPKDFGLCVNPEFLREGSAVENMLEPDRIVIGEIDKRSGDMLERFYDRVYMGHLPPMLKTTLDNAEIIKYATNAFLATKISFINSIANLCERIAGSDVEIIAKGVGLDPRIGPLFLEAGLGWGGSCFPKDVKTILAFGTELGLDLPIIRATMEVNESRPSMAVDKVKELLIDLQGKTVAVLGLAFKPNTDDVREAVSIKIINRLLEEGASVRAYDPVAIENSQRILGKKIIFTKSSRECLNGADCCILVTEWDDFRDLKPEDFRTRMRRPLLIDGRRLYAPKEFLDKMEYFAVGLGRVIS